MSVSSDPIYQRGLALAVNGDYTSAVPAFEDVARRHPSDPLALKELGLAYARRGEDALPPTLKEREIDSSDPAADASLTESIGSAFNAAIGLAFVQASKVVGKTDWIVRYRDDFRRAATALTSSAAIYEEGNNPDAEVYYVLSQCLRYLGQDDEALGAARRAVELAPNIAAYAGRARLIEAMTDSGSSGDLARPKWADVVLPAKTKRELRQMQLMLEDPKLALSLGVEPPTGLLLYGPPGTGKTTIARVLASEAKCKFFATSPAEINSMWLGESEKQVKKLFDQARDQAPSIIFLDEIDALLPSRSGGVNMYSDKVVNQFLHEMDGLRANRRVFVVGATNRRDMLDPALLRGGRLSREIEIPLPDADGRQALFALYMRGTSLAADVTPDLLEARAAEFSGANIRALINEAGLQALIRLAEQRESGSGEGEMPQLTLADFDEAFANFAVARPTPPASPYDTIRRIFT